MPVIRVSGLPLPANTTPAFATSVHSSKRYLLDQFGQPYFMVGDSGWNLATNVSTTDYVTYLSTRHNQGFNTVLTKLVDDLFGNSTLPASFKTFDGISAFTGTVGGFPDVTTPNSAYWSRMDTLVTTAATYGITILALPTNAGGQLDGGGPSQCTSMLRANGHANCVTYGQFLGNRYKNSPNVIWQHGNDYVSDNGTLTDDQYVGGILTGIATANPSALQTVEFTTGPSTSQYSLQASTFWVNNINVDLCYPTFTTLTGGSTATYTTEQGAYAASPTMPAFLGEGLYGGTGGGNNYALRTESYWTMTTGNIAGYLFGDNGVFAFGSGWQSNLSSSQVTELGYWATMFKGLNWQTLAPDTGNTFLTGGFSSGTTLSLAALDPAGSLGVVYCPAANNPVIAMSKMRGTVTARWFDPTLGSFSSIGTFSNTGSHTFTVPGAHADGNNDYVLVLTA